MEEIKKILSTILNEAKVLEEKIEQIGTAAKHTGEVVAPSATESLREVIKFTEESANKIIQQIDKVEQNCHEIDKTVEDLLSLNPINSIREKLSLIKEKNQENMNILIKVYELFSFQDLSAQQIKEVINILEDTKKKLLAIAVSSIESSDLPQETKEAAKGKVHELLSGDRIFQEDVDKLLEELGL
ncbi:MAG: protein phosphatase CheZ [Hydrogenothermaceae bacterium]